VCNSEAIQGSSHVFLLSGDQDDNVQTRDQNHDGDPVLLTEAELTLNEMQLMDEEGGPRKRGTGTKCQGIDHPESLMHYFREW
jgi:hypothetical protein